MTGQAGKTRQTKKDIQRDKSRSALQTGSLPSPAKADPLPEIADDVPDPHAAWAEYFSKHTPAPQDVADRVLQLHDRRRHEHVIAVLQQAVIHGHGQPWMYDTLALSMQIAGRPEEDVERILLSSVDFTAADVPAMIASAAILKRFGGAKQALHLYRQASRLDPTRPEPYALALKTAVELKDPEAITWAATGVLTYVWTDNHQQLHHSAERASLDALDILTRAGRNQEARELESAMAQARRRDLYVRLNWNGDGDLDLVVHEPPGTVCSFESSRTKAGGILAHDGYGPRQENCYDEYVCPLAMSGIYRILVRHVSGNIVGKRATLTVVRYQGTPEETRQTLPIVLTGEDRVVTVEVQRGRREKLLGALPQAMLPRHAAAANAGAAFDGNAPQRRALQRFEEARLHAGRQRGFVTGAVGFQPVVTILYEGTTLSANAVVSPDRRYVRMTVSPTFTSITDVLTFSFVNGNPPAP